eukprot:scaffold61067_cov19-Tisochrysis_lutea.AAC.2
MVLQIATACRRQPRASTLGPASSLNIDHTVASAAQPTCCRHCTRSRSQNHVIVNIGDKGMEPIH